MLAQGLWFDLAALTTLLAPVLLYEAACKFLGLTPAWAPPVSPERTVVHAADESPDEVPRIVLGAYDIRRDDAALRNIGLLPSPQWGEAFHH